MEEPLPNPERSPPSEPPPSQSADCIQCKALSLKMNKRTSLLVVAKEIARSLHESKHKLIWDIVKVLGFSVTMDLYHQTVRIQENGGRLTNDDESRIKTPGGVFIMLVKKTVSKEQREKIFRNEKKIKQINKQNRRKRLFKEKQEKAKLDKDGIKDTTTHSNSKQYRSNEGKSAANRVEPVQPVTSISYDSDEAMDCDPVPLTMAIASTDASPIDQNINDEIELAERFEEMNSIDPQYDFDIELA